MNEGPRVRASPASLCCVLEQRHANVSKQTTLLDGVDFGPPKWRICGVA